MLVYRMVCFVMSDSLKSYFQGVTESLQSMELLNLGQHNVTIKYIGAELWGCII